VDHKVVAKNRKAAFEYYLLEHIEAGISLKGSEIKSIRAGQVSLAEAYVHVENYQAWLMNAHIAPYDPASRDNHEPRRNRRLLLHPRELRGLSEAVKMRGMTIVPVQIYLKKGLAKIDIAIAKGKKLYDKRREIANRDLSRELQRESSQKKSER
jgi:SsrA-binding protein